MEMKGRMATARRIGRRALARPARSRAAWTRGRDLCDHRGHAVDGRLERDADHGVRSELIDHVVEEADS